MQELDSGRFDSRYNCVVSVWWGAPDENSLAALAELTQEVATRQSAKIAFLTILEEGAALIDAPQRQALERFYAKIDPLLIAAAQVVEGGNLWAVTARSVMTALRLVQRKNYPMRVFSGEKAALDWLQVFIRDGADAVSPDATIDFVRCSRGTPARTPQSGI